MWPLFVDFLLVYGNDESVKHRGNWFFHFENFIWKQEVYKEQFFQKQFFQEREYGPFCHPLHRSTSKPNPYHSEKDVF